MVATSPIDILRFLAARAADGVECAVVTLVGIEGGSSRAIGAQMAVAADGRRIGSFSGGCIEDSVATEALETLEEGWGRVVRYGIGSPYIDIRLPCGGGIDLLFTPRPDAKAIASALAALNARTPAALLIGCDTVTGSNDVTPSPWNGTAITLTYQPALQIHAFGQGEDLSAFTRLAAAFGAEVHAFTPDQPTCALLEQLGISCTHLPTRTGLPTITSDPWSAVLFLFHGRDWEEHVLPQALELPGFYHGAIGSRRTHAARLAALEAAGVPVARINALRGHIGLIPATRDPATLALSILGEIVADYNALAHWTYWTGEMLSTDITA